MRKGDVVTINDFSYSKATKGGRLDSGFERNYNEQYMVVEVGCRFPLERYQSDVYRNDTVIQSLTKDGQVINRGKVVFIHERFLKKCKIREVTMAEVCAQFGEDVKIRKD